MRVYVPQTKQRDPELHITKERSIQGINKKEYEWIYILAITFKTFRQNKKSRKCYWKNLLKIQERIDWLSA